MTAFEAVRGGISPKRLVRLLEDAVATYGPSYAESAAVDVFADALEEAGLSVQRLPVLNEDGEPSDPERFDLIVRIGPQPPALTWVGHTDTVVLIDEEQLRPTIRDGKLYGLGAADMKGACAAAVEATIALAHSGIHMERGIVLALVVGEEEYGDGCAALPDSVLGPVALVGEPTGLRPCLRHFSYEELSLRVRGARAHAALPEHGSNAIHAMLGWATRVLEATADEPWPETPVAINPRTIRGGDSMFAIAEECAAEVDAHLPPRVEIDAVRRIVEETAAAAMDAHPGCTCEWETVFSAPGYAVEPDDPAMDVFKRGFALAGVDWSTEDFRSHSDAVALRERGVLPVICGPGDLAVAHTIDEHIPLDQLEQAAFLYAAIFTAAVSGGPRSDA
jgi:acetylornithine deacetylase